MLWLQATLKRYQTEHRSKLDSLEKSQAELKKIRRKSQGARNVTKYEHKEMEVSACLLPAAFSCSMNWSADGGELLQVVFESLLNLDS